MATTHEVAAIISRKRNKKMKLINIIGMVVLLLASLWIWSDTNK